MAPLASNNQRVAFKRETLLKSVSLVVAKLAQLDLPATITAIYALGGVLRDKERLHDVDAICLYSQTPEQQEWWERFRENFSSVSLHDRKRRPIQELWDLLKPLYEQQVPFARAIKNEEFSEALASRGVEPQWAACFSWTDILHNPLGFFFPYIERVLQRMLLGGTKGLSFIFMPHEEFIQGKSYFSKLNSVLAWSPEKPDIVANLLGRTLEQKIKLVIRELDMFLTLICELKAQYEEAKVSLRQAPIKLNFEALERCYTEISYTAQESYPELLAECEQARSEMRRFNEEIEVLKTIKSALPNITKPREGPILANPTEEQVAWFTLEWQPKYEVKEKRIREILRTLALPEDKVKTVKRRGFKTEYELIKPIWKRQK